MITRERVKYLIEKWKSLKDFTKLSNEEKKKCSNAILIEPQEIWINSSKKPSPNIENKPCH